MTHKVGKEGEVVEAVEEVFGETMTERVRINDCRTNAIFVGKDFELLCYTASGDTFSESIQKNVA